MGIDASTVARAKAVKEADPDLYEQIGQPEVPTVNFAYKKIKQRSSRPSTLNKRRGTRSNKDADWVADSEKKKRLAEGQYKRLWTGLGSIDVICHELPRLDRGMIRSFSSPENIAEAISLIRKSVRELLAFAKLLEAK